MPLSRHQVLSRSYKSSFANSKQPKRKHEDCEDDEVLVEEFLRNRRSHFELIFDDHPVQEREKTIQVRQEIEVNEVPATKTSLFTDIFDNLKYEIVKRRKPGNPRRVKIAVSGWLDDILKWQDDVLTGKCEAAELKISPEIFVEETIDRYVPDLNSFVVDWKRDCSVESAYFCFWCDSIVEKRREHIGKKHLIELENAILTKLGEKPSYELLLFLMQTFHFSLAF
mgnify:CR=1 FL=1